MRGHAADRMNAGTTLYVINGVQVGPLFFEGIFPHASFSSKDLREVPVSGVEDLKNILSSHGITEGSDQLGFVAWVFENVMAHDALHSSFLEYPIKELEEKFGGHWGGVWW